MGATDFGTTAKGKTAKDAFMKAVKEAQFENGHCGYTGTIAEKSSFKMVYAPSAKTAKTRARYANALIDSDSCPSWLEDKWGPAGCIELRKNEYYFFGIASC